MSEVGKYDEDTEEGEASNQDDDNDSASISSIETVEPSCEQANNIRFATICKMMEDLWKVRRLKIKKKSQEEKFDRIMPKKLLQSMNGQTLFPLIRLYCPDIDSRNYKMQESAIAKAYIGALALRKDGKLANMLKHYTDSQAVQITELVGDLSLVVEHVVRDRRNGPGSKMKVGDINRFLDELASLGQEQHHNHQWREGERTKKKTKRDELKKNWLLKVMNRDLSPLEHKWMVRIIMKKVEFGMRSQTILKLYSPFAMELWGAHNSLKSLCDKLANPEYEKNRRLAEEEKRKLNQGLFSRWEPQTQPVILGNMFTPMLSSKLTFEKCMTQITMNHAEYLKTATDQECLPLRFPVVCAETKLDGERMIIHIQDGKVKMHTRNRVWYSEIYVPVLGKPLRKALKYKVDVILDGEVMAWDNRKKELVPFGYNRMIANYRRLYLRKEGLDEDIDTKLHPEGSSNARVMRENDDWMFQQQKEDTGHGKECWLLFSVFDVLYVNGKDATRLLQKDCGLEHVNPGSIIHLSCLERKQVLHQLVEEQENEIEICKSVVIRPNGDFVPGNEYFGMSNLEFGYESTLLDSTQAAMTGLIPSRAEIDAELRGDQSFDTISRRRADAIEGFFNTVVELHKREGIVIKDLAAPYILGEPSRRRKYWHKFKPDYEKGNAVDLDVVILGGTYASGLKHSGKPVSFLCGCRDSLVEHSYMTFCYVNGGSASFDRLEKLLDHTGFKQATKNEPMQLGKWFLPSDLPPGEDLPEFISQRSFQRGDEDQDGWKFKRNKNYPDMWINPEDSVVLTIEGQEIVETEEYSAGVCLRFPKISKIRLDEMDGGKAANEVDNESSFWDTYSTIIRQRQDREGNSQMQGGSLISRRFLTPEEFNVKTKKRKRRAIAPPSSKIPKVSNPKTKILSGCTFTVLDGKYSLDADSLDARGAKEEGWHELALECKKKEHVMEFILNHGGNVKVAADIGDKLILGGKDTDARVRNHMKGIKNAREIVRAAPAKCKRTEDLMLVADSKGILKWTFVYSVVHRWIKDQIGSSRSKEALPPIMKSDPSFLVPKLHHYLVRDAPEDVQTTQDIFDLDTSRLTETDFERAIQEIGDRTDNVFKIPWQNKSFWLDLFDDEDDAKRSFETAFWPFSMSAWSKVIVYPHISDHIRYSSNDDCKEALIDSSINYWNEIESEDHAGDISYDCILSSLPLAESMGAMVSLSFNEHVSHIVCDLIDGMDCIDSFRDLRAKSIFQDFEKSKCLIPLLEALSDSDRQLQIVSPAWIRKQWEEHYSMGTTCD